MREAPIGVSDADILSAVREHWLPGVQSVTHLPVGFGAHHWRADDAHGPTLFVTLDTLRGRHTLVSLRSAYAGAARLAEAGLEFVLAPQAPYAVAFDGGGAGNAALSVTGWLDGPAVGPGEVVDPDGDAALLRRLHDSDAGPIPEWKPLVTKDFAARLRHRLDAAWDSGPYGPQTRDALQQRIESIATWTASYHRLAEVARRHRWVPTHGEPHTRNQMHRGGGQVVLVDWESLKHAPRERDLRGIVDAGRADLVDPDTDMLEMFDLEWRLDEISQYVEWFAAPHSGSASDRVALDGLLHELDRP